MRKRAGWVQVYRSGPNFYLNGTVYTDLDEPLRLARKRAEKFKGNLRVYYSSKYGGGVMLSGYRTSDNWHPVDDRTLSFDKAWEVFVNYARML